MVFYKSEESIFIIWDEKISRRADLQEGSLTIFFGLGFVSEIYLHRRILKEKGENFDLECSQYLQSLQIVFTIYWSVNYLHRTRSTKRFLKDC